MPIQVPIEKWSGKVREVTLGATRAEGGTRSRTLTVGGETTLPFLHFEGKIPHASAVAIEVRSRRPADWSPLLLDVWGAAVDNPAAWAVAAEAAGADAIALTLTLEDSAADARAILRQVLGATGLPLLVFGPGQAEKDNELIVAAAEEGKGERLVLGVCEDKNYRTMVAAALAHGHLINSRTPMDVNLAKQLIILIRDMGLGLERILMDPSTGALGYGVEYGYSVMERLRIAALQGDSMTQQPMLVSPGEEAWKTKEAKVSAGVPPAWGDWGERALHWEALTAMTLIQSGADLVVLRHPESLQRVHRAVAALMAQAQPEQVMA
jgi:acetyl-CoA decarbonylase/synthase complex subunit delta